MLAHVDHADLAAALRTVAPAITARPALPVLGGVRLAAAAGRLRLTGTDLETTITTELAADVAADGAALVPFDVLRRLLGGKRPKATTVELGAGGDHGELHVAIAGSTTRLRLLSLEDFPVVPGAGRPVADVPADTVQAWSAVIGAASDDETRPVLCAVLLEVGPGDQITAAATDSYRLHVHAGQAAVHDQTSLLVPAAALATVVKAAKAAKADRVVIGTVPGDAAGDAAAAATFALGPTTLAVRPTEGQFPSFRNLIPDAEAGDLVIRVADAKLAARALTDATVAVEALAGPARRRRGGPPVVLSAPEGGVPAMTVTEQDVGTWQAELAGTVVEQAPCDRLAFTPAYLLDLLAAAQVGGARELTLRGRDAAKPVVLRNADGFTGLLMPVRLAG